LADEKKKAKLLLRRMLRLLSGLRGKEGKNEAARLMKGAEKGFSPSFFSLYPFPFPNEGSQALLFSLPSRKIFMPRRKIP